MNPLEYKKRVEQLKKGNSRPNKLALVKHELLEALIRENRVTPMKIIFYIAKSNLTLKKQDYHKITINTKNLCEYCNINEKTLKRNIKKMQETSITFVSEEIGEDGYRKIEEYISLIPYAKFDYNGNLIIDIHDKIAKLIMSVKKPYSEINAENLMRLSHKHSIKMIQILERIANFSDAAAKRKHYTLDELNALFGVNYKTLKQFKQAILDRVKEELDAVSIYSFESRLYKDKLDKRPGRPGAQSIVIDLIQNQPRLF